MKPQPSIIYAHDPMCAWCWAFRPAYEIIERVFLEKVDIVRLLGGLAPDTDQPMSEEMRSYMESTWRGISQHVPGTQFNFDFWRHCEPRRSTYPACRAVIAARQQGDEYDRKMTSAIQHAYYLKAQNPSDTSTLVGLASILGLDRERFVEDLVSDATQKTFGREMQYVRSLNIRGFPTLLVVVNGRAHSVTVQHNDGSAMVERIHQIFEESQAEPVL